MLCLVLLTPTGVYLWLSDSRPSGPCFFAAHLFFTLLAKDMVSILPDFFFEIAASISYVLGGSSM